MNPLFTFDEEVLVANAIYLRIEALSKSIKECRMLNLDCPQLCQVRDTLKVCYHKLTGTDYDKIH